MSEGVSLRVRVPTRAYMTETLQECDSGLKRCRKRGRRREGETTGASRGSVVLVTLPMFVPTRRQKV